MIRITHEVWAPMVNTDRTEGKGTRYPLAYFTEKEDAEKAAEKKGVWGFDAPVEKKTVEVVIFESYDEYREK